MQSTDITSLTLRGWLSILGGVALLIVGWLQSDSVVEMLLACTVAVSMIGFGMMLIRERQIRPRYADLAMWLVTLSVLFLLF